MGRIGIVTAPQGRSGKHGILFLFFSSFFLPLFGPYEFVDFRKACGITLDLLFYVSRKWGERTAHSWGTREVRRYAS